MAINVGAWTHHARSAWKGQEMLAPLDAGLPLDTLKPRMLLIHWAAELYLKAFLKDRGVRPPDSRHDLDHLYALAIREDPSIHRAEWQEAVAEINPFNNDDFGGVRYPSQASYHLSSETLQRLEACFMAIEEAHRFGS